MTRPRRGQNQKMTNDPCRPQPTDTFSKLIDVLNEQVSLVHLEWQLYRSLYSGEGRVEVLDKVAPTAFWVIQYVFLDAVVLGLMRLADPARTTVKGRPIDNATFRQLLDALPDERYSIRSDLKMAVDQFAAATSDLSIHRNKRIAHLDLDSALRGCQQLPPIQTDTIAEALRLAAATMNVVRPPLQPMVFDRVWAFGGGTDLIRALKQARKLRQIQDRMWDEQLSLDQLITLIREPVPD